MKLLALFIYAIICVGVSILPQSNCQAFGLKKDSCGDDNVIIYFSDYEDYRIGCIGYRYAKKHFKKLGYSVDIPITIHFERPLYVPCPDAECNSKDIYGYSNLISNTIHIRSLFCPIIWNQEREYLRIKYDKKDWIASDLRLEGFHISVVVHEVAHIIAEHNFRILTNQEQTTSPAMAHGVHEYIASVAQMKLLNDIYLLYYILKKYEPSIRFDREENINFFLCAADPHKFMVMSIRHFHSMNETGQKKFFRRILTGKFNPDINFEIVGNRKSNPILSTYLK